MFQCDNVFIANDAALQTVEHPDAFNGMDMHDVWHQPMEAARLAAVERLGTVKSAWAFAVAVCVRLTGHGRNLCRCSMEAGPHLIVRLCV